jgi:hypothetical protein
MRGAINGAGTVPFKSNSVQPFISTNKIYIKKYTIYNRYIQSYFSIMNGISSGNHISTGYTTVKK